MRLVASTIFAITVGFLLADGNAALGEQPTTKDAGETSTTKVAPIGEVPTREDAGETSISRAAADAIQSMNAQPIPTQLASLEIDAFSHAYKSDTNEERLCRLEHFVFGKQLHGDPNARLKKLINALQPIDKSRSATANIGGNSSRNSSTNGLKHGAGESSQPTIPITNEGASESTTAPYAPPPAPTKTRVSVIDVINRGIDNYNQHRYQNADEDFEEACAMAPGMARCYSYLAITKMQLNLRQAAIDAFRMSTMIDPFGTYGRYARSCLIVLAGDEAMRKRPPVDSKKVLDIAMSNIDKQSSDIMSRHRSQAELIANSRNARTGYPWVESRIDSNSARIEGALRAAHAAESANNLKHMLAVKKMPGDANLRAWGTTLTTRYYGNETYLNPPYYIPKERPMELKAIVQSLNGKHSPASNGLMPAQNKKTSGKSGHGKHISSTHTSSIHDSSTHTSSTRSHSKKNTRG